MRALREIGRWLSDLWNLFFPSKRWLDRGEDELEEWKRRG